MNSIVNIHVGLDVPIILVYKTVHSVQTGSILLFFVSVQWISLDKSIELSLNALHIFKMTPIRHGMRELSSRLPLDEVISREAGQRNFHVFETKKKINVCVN